MPEKEWSHHKDDCDEPDCLSGEVRPALHGERRQGAADEPGGQEDRAHLGVRRSRPFRGPLSAASRASSTFGSTHRRCAASQESLDIVRYIDSEATYGEPGMFREKTDRADLAKWRAAEQFILHA